jgi:hypothetical protein
VGHVLGERVRMHRDLGMAIGAESLRAFDADRAITESRAFRRTPDDSDVSGHGGSIAGDQEPGTKTTDP